MANEVTLVSYRDAIYSHLLKYFILYERATLARATRIVIHSIFVLGPSALGMGKSYL